MPAREAWTELDEQVLEVLADAGGQMTPWQLARELGMSEDGVRSVLSMLAEKGAIRILAVALVRPRSSGLRLTDYGRKEAA